MVEVKPFKTYKEQVELLESRFMTIQDTQHAQKLLENLNYYRLSGYWHTMRAIDPETKESLNEFRPGASLQLVVDLYNFDERLRTAVFADLMRIELAVRALMGYHLGQIDSLIHLKPALLGATAHQPDRYNADRTVYDVWRSKFNKAVRDSKEDFVVHHRDNYDGKLPIWVAVEVMDWGMLSHLYRIGPSEARNEVARRCNLNAAQLESWLRSLNILRNYAAHHARLFNRGFDIKPKLSKDPKLDAIRGVTNRAFGQLTLVRYLHEELQLEHVSTLSEVLQTYPHNDLVPFSRMGAPEDWQEHPLWQKHYDS